MSIKIRNVYLLVFGLSCIGIAIPVFHSGLYITHDGVNHVARFVAYVRAFHEFHIPPRWAGYLNYSYGSPVFNFFYPTPGYIAFVLSFFVKNPEMIFKIISYSAFIAAPITFFFWIKGHLQKPYAFAISTMYGLSLYHIANLLVRGDVAELVSITFVPLILLFVDTRKPSASTAILGGCMYALTILSHNGIGLMFSPIILLYMFIKLETSTWLKSAFSYAGMLSIGLSLSAFFWIPALYEKKYTNIVLFTGDFYSKNFLHGLAPVFAPWGFGPDVNKAGGFAPQLGIVPVVLCVLFFIRLTYAKKLDRIAVFWTGVVVLGTLMTTSLSANIWSRIPFLKIIQFPWRFMAVANFAIFAALSVYGKNLKITSHVIPIILLSVTLLSTLPFVRVAGYEHRPIEFYKNFPHTTYFHGEATTIWSTGDFSAYPTSPVEVASGIAKISGYKKSNARHVYTVTSETAVDIVDNTLYYPGWQVRANGVKIPIEFQNAHHRGLITYTLNKGTHLIDVSFHETPIRLASNVISSIMGTVVIMFFIQKLFWHANY